MHDDEKTKDLGPLSGISRRDFLKIGGLTLAATPALEGPRILELDGEQIELVGPGKVPITLEVDGRRRKLEVEPRVTLLDALRDQLEVTASKRVCDRASCGACTVLLDGKAVYACTMLAIEAQGHKIQTAESFLSGDQLHPLQQAFVDHDGQQCGFCTPGFVVAAKAFLDRNPGASFEEIAQGLGGNLCRCGTYVGVREAVMAMAKGGGNG